jgi:PAS domain S-box-containing protein
MKAPLPIDEEERLAALREYDVLDTPAEESFDDLTFLAAKICETPIALVALVDESRQWFKSKIGISEAETPRDIAFCAHAILHKDEVLEVRDAKADPRFADNLLVTGDSHVRFYAGTPLVTPGGQALGALCVMDTAPRTLTAGQRAALRALSRHVVAQLELRRQARELAREVAVRQRGETRLRRQLDQLSAAKAETDRLLTVAHKSRWALLSVLEDEQRAGKKLRESEQRGRQSERRLREMLENVELIAMTLDKTGRVTFCNDYLLKLTGWTREEVIGSDWGSKFLPGNPEVMQRFPETIEAGEVPAHYQNPIRTRDGRLREIVWNNTMLRDVAGNITGTASIGEDVTEREGAVARVRELADMLDHAHEAIVVRDVHTRRITFWNRGAERLYGWSADEAVGQDMGELIFVIPEALDRVTRHAVETGEWRGEHRHVSKSGQRLTVSSHVTLVRDAHGTPKSALVINFDITSQKQLEEQLLRAQRMESIGTLASGVAHDLNNILSPILMSAPMLREELPADLRERIVGTIEKSAQRGADIVKQVLTFARGVQGERLLIQPAHLVDEMAKIAEQAFPKSVTLTTRYPSGVWAVEGDPTQLHQILLNLCVNARDSMPDGGELIVSLENITVDEQFAAMVPGSRSGPHVIIAVGDTGTGIPREIIDKIFDPFFTTKETGKGTGLGLSTVLGIVKSHGGFLTVDSEAGRGTTFKIFLPATGTEAEDGAAAETASLPGGNAELILVVDDEESILQITQTILEKYGYRVITAVDGTDALGLFAKQMGEIKVVLADVMMPFMDGVALARILKRMSPQTPVIACSGQCEEVREGQLRDAGVKMFLRKPYTRGNLLNALRTVLDGA